MLRTLFAALVTMALGAATADAKILITVDKATQQMIVEVDGVTRWQWPVSTGRRGYATPSGTYAAFRMEEDHYSKEFDDAPMPHSIFFTKRGHAIHGSYETRRLGTPVSSGCVRLHPANAAKLFTLVAQRGVTTATVVITSGESEVARPRAPREEPGIYQQPPDYRGFPGYGQPGPGYYRPSYEPSPRGGYGGSYYERW